MPIDLYGTITSPPFVAVMLTAKALDIPINHIETMYASDAVRTPEYIKMNPQKTVPTLSDNGLYLNESRAMMQYLCNQYAKDDTLYPKNPRERAVIDSRLLFDIGTIYDRLATAYYRVCFRGQPKFIENDMKRLDEALGFLETYLEHGYIAGKKMSIADLTMTVTVSVLESVNHNLQPFPRVREYLARMKKEVKGYQEYVQKGNDIFLDMCAAIMEKARQAK